MIKIKKSHQGLLHKNLGVKAGNKIPASKLAIHSGDSSTIKKRKQFAINAKKWHHGENGLSIPDSWTPGQPLSFNPLMGSSTDTIDPKIGAPIVDPKKKTDWRDNILLGLTALDRILPTQHIHPPVVQPMETYNQHPLGTGSEAMYPDGGIIVGSPNKNVKTIEVPMKGQSGSMSTWAVDVDHPNSVQSPKGNINIYNAVDRQGNRRTYTQDEIAPYLSPNIRNNQAVTSYSNTEAPKSDSLYVAPNASIFYPKFDDGGILDTGDDPTGSKKSRRSKQQDCPNGDCGDGVHINLPRITLPNISFRGREKIDPNEWLINEAKYDPLGGGHMNSYYPTTSFDPQPFKDVPQYPSLSKPYGVTYQPTNNMMATGGSLTPEKADMMLHDGTVRGRNITDRQRRYFGAVASGDSPKAAAGATIQPIANNPYSPGQTVQFNGPSHDEGGIQIPGAEVQGGETAHTDPTGNTIISGGMQYPGTSKKFQTVSKDMAKHEDKANQQKQKATDIANEIVDPKNKFEALKLNASELMGKGADMKLKALADQRQHMAMLQQAMLDTAHEHGIDPQQMSKGNIKKMSASDMAKYGMTVKKYAAGGTMEMSYDDGGTPWDFRGTNTKKMDPKIMKFVQMVQDKGYTGYSGTKSGYDNRMTSTGRPSRHSTNQALDMMFNDPDVYHKILKDPDLTGYLMNNGLTAINEYDPKVAYQTDATTGHIHVGYDKGTAVSDQFRKDAHLAYPDQFGDNTNKSYTPVRIGKGPGDAQTEVPVSPYIKTSFDNYLPSITPDTPNKTYTPPQTGAFNVPDQGRLPTNQEKLDPRQLYPEIYAAAANKLQAVQAQKYIPQLEQPYQVSFQDRINENTAGFNAIKPLLDYSPESLSNAAGQLYSANAPVKADEFRQNDATNRGIYDKNIETLNDANFKNLSIADQQYVRQSTARSKTKTQDETILSSVADKYLQNKLNNESLMARESMTGYRFKDTDGDGQPDTLAYEGGPAAFRYDPVSGKMVTPSDESGGKKKLNRDQTKVTYDRYHIPVKTVDTDTEDKASGGSIPSLYNQVYGKYRKQ